MSFSMLNWAIDGIASATTDAIEFDDVISSAFDSIKDIWNAILLILYYTIFFILFMIFLGFAFFLYVALSIWIFKQYTKYNKTISAILMLDIKKVKKYKFNS